MTNNDPLIYLASAAALLDTYRKACNHERHGLDDLMLYEMLINLTVDGEYGDNAEPLLIMHEIAAAGRHLNSDVQGYTWEWVQDMASDLMEELGYKRVDEEGEA